MKIELANLTRYIITSSQVTHTVHILYDTHENKITTENNPY